jgi:uncharacterized protein YjbJ (UPF0337 family)
MNKDIAQGKWTEIKGEIQKTWGNLTGDELEKTKGDMKAVSGLLQQKYGLAKDEAATKISGIYGRFQDARTETEKVASKASASVKSDLKQFSKN